jgi:hypothetical protein
MLDGLSPDQRAQLLALLNALLSHHAGLLEYQDQ